MTIFLLEALGENLFPDFESFWQLCVLDSQPSSTFQASNHITLTSVSIVLSLSVTPLPPSTPYKSHCDYTGRIIWNNLPIKNPLTLSHLPSPFCHGK